jgi:hypothetical protein
MLFGQPFTAAACIAHLSNAVRRTGSGVDTLVMLITRTAVLHGEALEVLECHLAALLIGLSSQLSACISLLHTLACSLASLALSIALFLGYLINRQARAVTLVQAGAELCTTRAVCVGISLLLRGRAAVGTNTDLSSVVQRDGASL